MRSKTSKQWLKEHEADFYVREARKAGYRGRAVYKLQEIQNKNQLLKPHHRVVDLGAAPGSWSQYVKECLNNQGQIIALDCLPMAPLEGIDFIQGDFTEESTLHALEACLKGEKVDVVLSDMAPNASGIPDIDQPRSMALGELALDFALNWLRPGGSFVVKLFHGEGFDDYIKEVRQHFQRVVVRKPKASRPRSRETYCVAQGF